MKVSIHAVILLAFFSAVLLGSSSFLFLSLMVSRFRQRAARLTAASAMAFAAAALIVVAVFELNISGISRSVQYWSLGTILTLILISVILAWKSYRATMARYGADAPDSLYGKHEVGSRK